MISRAIKDYIIWAMQRAETPVSVSEMCKMIGLRSWTREEYHEALSELLWVGAIKKVGECYYLPTVFEHILA